MTVRCISGSVLWNGQVSKSMTTIEKAIALGIKAAAAHSPTSDAEYVSAHVGKYLTNTLWTYGPSHTSRLFKDLVEAREADRLARS